MSAVLAQAELFFVKYLFHILVVKRWKNCQWCSLEVDMNNLWGWPCSCSSLCDNERDPLGAQYPPVSDSHNTQQTDNLHTQAEAFDCFYSFIFSALY